MNPFILAICVVVSLFVGVIGSVCFIKWGVLEPAFYSLRLIEVLQLIVDLVIALFVAYYLTTRTHNEQRQKQIRAEFLDDVLKLAQEVYHEALNYMTSPSMIQSRELILMFDDLMGRISLFDDKNKLGNGIDNLKIKTSFLEFKESVTSGSFHAESAVFSKEEKRSCITKYLTFSTELLIAKLGLYSK